MYEMGDDVEFMYVTVFGIRIMMRSIVEKRHCVEMCY